MLESSYEFLKLLVAAPSPSGYEQPAQRVFIDYVKQYAEISTDILGNVTAFIPGTGKNRLKVMLVAHCDEIGFQVKYIDDSGYIWFGAVGGVDPHITIGQHVLIHTADGPVAGVIGRKPIHLLEAKDRDSVIKLDNQYIDIGVASRKEAEELIRMGDPITFAAELIRLQGDRVASRGFDDKAGCFVVAEVLRLVAESDQKLPLDLYVVSSVQEEVGLRGGRTSSYAVDPDVGICVDVYFSSDQPDVDKKLNGEILLGNGPVVPRGNNINPVLFELITTVANNQDIPVQLIALPRVSGTDANVMQVSRSGVATALVTLPLRYMHSPVEVLSLADLEHAARLITATLSCLTDRAALVPR